MRISSRCRRSAHRGGGLPRARGRELHLCGKTEPDDAGYVERYWVSVSSGLLAAAERECDGAVVYRMAALTVSYDGVDAEDFTLPNGTVLYEPAVAATKEISEKRRPEVSRFS